MLISEGECHWIHVAAPVEIQFAGGRVFGTCLIETMEWLSHHLRKTNRPRVTKNNLGVMKFDHTEMVLSPITVPKSRNENSTDVSFPASSEFRCLTTPEV